MQGRFSITKIKESLDPIVQWGSDVKGNMSKYYNKFVKGVRRNSSSSFLNAMSSHQKDQTALRKQHFYVGASIITSIVLFFVYLIASSYINGISKDASHQLKVLLSRLDTCSSKNFKESSVGEVKFLFKDLSDLYNYNKSSNSINMISYNSSLSSMTSQLIISSGGRSGINEKIVRENSEVLCYNNNHAIKPGVCIMLKDTSKYYRRYVENYKDYGKTKGHFAFSCLPTFIIAGAMKSGTGELMHWLNKHPQLLSGFGSKHPVKSVEDIKEYSREVKFFGSLSPSLNADMKNNKKNSSCPIIDYLGHFPFMSYNKKLSNLITATSMTDKKVKSFKMSDRNIHTFDKTPYYMRDTKALDEIKQFFPSMKIVVVLRNPTSRAISGFGHNCRKKRYFKLISSQALTVHLNLNATYSGNAIKIHQSLFSNGNTALDLKPNSIISKEVLDHLSHNNDLWRKEVVSKKKSKEKSKYISNFESNFKVLDYPCSEIDLHNYYFGDLSQHFDKMTNILSRNDAFSEYLEDSGNVGVNSHKSNSDFHDNNNKSNSIKNYNDNINLHSRTRHNISNPLHNHSHNRQQKMLRKSEPMVGSHINGNHEDSSNSQSVRDRRLWEFSLFNKTFSIFGEKSKEIFEINIDPREAIQRTALMELDVGFYDHQIQNLLMRFPKEQLLILFQEDMLRNTLGAIRKVENFIGLNCFDFSSIVDVHSIRLEDDNDILASAKVRNSELEVSEENHYGFRLNRSSCGESGKICEKTNRVGEVIDHAKRSPGTKYPIKRVSKTFHGRIENRLYNMWNFIRGNDGNSYFSINTALQSKALPITRALLDELYVPHNRRLAKILMKFYGDAVKIPDSWSM